MPQLAAESLNWALKHLELEGDGDLFPKPFEIGVIKRQWATIKTPLERLDFSNYQWNPLRTVLVPKDEISFRRACQLDPIDALVFGALIYEIGQGIETRRRPEAEKSVFS